MSQRWSVDRRVDGTTSVDALADLRRLRACMLGIASVERLVWIGGVVHSDQGTELAINRSQVRLPVVTLLGATLDKLFTHVCLCYAVVTTTTPPAHHSHPPSLHIHCFIPGSKLTFSTNLFHHSLLAPTWTAFSDYTEPDLLCSTVFRFQLFILFYFLF